MPRSTAHRILCGVGVIVGLLGGSSAAWSGSDTEQKGAQVYCFMRSSGNAHEVSWNAAYALIKRQSRGLFKTSPEHASVMITEAVVKDPGTFPDCGQYLGDLFGGATTATAASLGSTSTATQTATAFSSDGYAAGGNERYSYCSPLAASTRPGPWAAVDQRLSGGYPAEGELEPVQQQLLGRLVLPTVGLIPGPMQCQC